MADDAEEPRNPRAGWGVRVAVLALVALVLVGVMLRLSLWQWDRAQARHSLLNYTYAGEWALFALLTVAGFARLALEDARPARGGSGPDADPDAAPGAPPPGGPVIGPPLRPGEELEEITWIRLRRRVGLER